MSDRPPTLKARTLKGSVGGYRGGGGSQKQAEGREQLWTSKSGNHNNLAPAYFQGNQANEQLPLSKVKRN